MRVEWVLCLLEDRSDTLLVLRWARVRKLNVVDDARCHRILRSDVEDYIRLNCAIFTAMPLLSIFADNAPITTHEQGVSPSLSTDWLQGGWRRFGGKCRSTKLRGQITV